MNARAFTTSVNESSGLRYEGDRLVPLHVDAERLVADMESVLARIPHLAMASACIEDALSDVRGHYRLLPDQMAHDRAVADVERKAA